jgi:cyanophycin synthetase
MEEEHKGYVHRGTLINGKVAGILRREPASVIGDGVHTVSELIKIENQNPLRKGPIFHEIIITDETNAELARQNLKLESVPAKNSNVALGQKASRGVGGGATDMTDDAHPDNLEMLELVAKVLGDPLVGVDFMMEDVTQSWREQKRSGVIECNSMPFIDLHHHPLRGKVRDVAGLVWDMTFPKSKN